MDALIIRNHLERLSLLIGKKKILAIDWDNNALYAIVFNPDLTAPKIIKAIWRRFDENVDVNDAESLGLFIRNTLKEYGINVSSAVFAIGRERAFLHHLEIPACPENQLANLVRFQLAQELPFAIEEARVDYVITGRNEQNYVTNVLACAVRIDTLESLMRIAKSANLKLVRIGLRPYVNYLAIKNLFELSEGITLFVNQRWNEIEIDAFKKSGLIFSRSAGISDKAETEDSHSYIVRQSILQLKRTVQICNANPQFKMPEKILVAGTSGCEAELVDCINDEFDISAELVELPIELADESASSWAFVSLLGLAIGYALPEISRFDFMSPKQAIDPQAIRARQIRLAVAAIAMIMLLGITYSHRLIADRRHEYAKLKSIDKKKAKELRSFKKFENQIYSIEDWYQRNVNWLEELQSITELMPSNNKAYIRSMVLVENKKPGMLAQIIIDGQAVSSKVVDEILQSLAKSGRYSEIRPGKQIPREKTSRYPESFKIRLAIAKRKMAAHKQTSKNIQKPKKKQE